MTPHHKAWLRAALMLAGILPWNLGAKDLFPPAGPGECRIVAYNVENYTTIPRCLHGKAVADAGKPEAERNAVARSIAEIRPDIIGLMEIGSPAEFADLRRRLRREGLDYGEAEYLEGADHSRHLALLSRFPIVERHSLANLPLKVGSITLHAPRGLIDVTVEPSTGRRVRILCVHLKSKLEVTDYDASSLREAEAVFLRKRVREILSLDPAARLVVMGDFNDTKNSRVLWEIAGKPDWPDALRNLPLSDRNGENWTEFWENADVYSRIDYMMVSKKLEDEIDPEGSAVARFPFWREASDHCPLVLTLRNSSTDAPADPSPLPSR